MDSVTRHIENYSQHVGYAWEDGGAMYGFQDVGDEAQVMGLYDRLTIVVNPSTFSGYPSNVTLREYLNSSFAGSEESPQGRLETLVRFTHLPVSTKLQTYVDSEQRQWRK